MKDVRVPAQLMRAMAAEAEAAREARAKVTNNIVMERSVMLTMIVLMHIQNIGEARAKVTNIIVAC